MIFELERHIETYLVNRCSRLGWLCEKFEVRGKRGVPDRLITAQNYICWVEVKKKGGRLSRLQKLDHTKRRALGADVYVVWNKQQVDDLIKTIQEKCK